MELGSLVCTPSEPDCRSALYRRCVRRMRPGCRHEIPRPKRQKAYTEVREAAVVVRKNGRVLMRQCGPGERWAGLWDFPRFRARSRGPTICPRGNRGQSRRANRNHVRATRCVLKTIRHGVTRYRITLDCYRAAYVSGRISTTSRHDQFAGFRQPNYPPCRSARPAEKLLGC